MGTLGILLGAVLVLTGGVVLAMLPKVSSAQRPLLRLVALAQLAVGAVAVVYFALPR